MADSQERAAFSTILKMKEETMDVESVDGNKDEVSVHFASTPSILIGYVIFVYGNAFFSLKNSHCNEQFTDKSHDQLSLGRDMTFSIQIRFLHLEMNFVVLMRTFY